jgi:hypothetical protein
MWNIDVISMRTLDRGNIRAFVDIRWGPIVIRDFKIVQQGLQLWRSHKMDPICSDKRDLSFTGGHALID